MSPSSTLRLLIVLVAVSGTVRTVTVKPRSFLPLTSSSPSPLVSVSALLLVDRDHSVPFLEDHRSHRQKGSRRARYSTAMSSSTASSESSSNDPLHPPARLVLSLRDRFIVHTATATEMTVKSSQDQLFELVLASQSPRRREILDMMGLQGRYRAQPSPLNETSLQLELRQPQKDSSVNDTVTSQNDNDIPMSPIQYTKRLAEAKAFALAQHEQDGESSMVVGQTTKRPYSSDEKSTKTITTLYLGSDTIVELDGDILEKPRNEHDAFEMLQRLSGRQHHVHTGVALYAASHPPSSGTNTTVEDAVMLVDSFVDTATVQFVQLSIEDIQSYIETKEPMDKAGSYGIQGIGGQFVQRIEGDFFTVMGLPMNRVSHLLSKAVTIKE